jgi:maltose O-acetyltransferase
MMRVLQYLWFHMVTMATAWLPDLRPVLRLRGFLVRPAFASCGRNLQVARRVTINFTNRLVLGSDVFLGMGCWLQAQGGITLEDEVQLGPYAVLVAGDHTAMNGSYRTGESHLAPIRVGRGTWIAAHATVTKGVIIGSGALLAANSVVTHNIPAFCLAAGVPARILPRTPRIEVVR